MPDFNLGRWDINDEHLLFYGEDEDVEGNIRLVEAAPKMYRLLEECADELSAIGLPTLSQECYDLLKRIDGKGEQS